MKALKLSTVLALLIFTEVGRADPLDTWSWRYPLPPHLPLNAIAYGNGQFVVGERGVILTSGDRVNWVQHFSGANTTEGIAYGKRFTDSSAQSFVLETSDLPHLSPDRSAWYGGAVWQK